MASDSLGLLETKGFVALMEATDTMLKAASVRLVKYERVGGGLAAVCIGGELAAVRAAIESGLAAVPEAAQASSTVLAKPSEAVWSMLRCSFPSKPLPDSSALGLVETRGFVSGVVAVDTMDKAAGIVFLGYENIGDGLVTVMIGGDLAAVKHAVEAGAAAVRRVGELISAKVVSRPQAEIEQVLLLASGIPTGSISQPPAVGALPPSSRHRRKR